MLRRIALLALVVVGVGLCVAQQLVAPRDPVSGTEMERIASAFKAVTIAWAEAADSGDIEAIRALHTDDIVHHDETFGAHIVGIDRVVSMLVDFKKSSPLLQRLVTDWFVGSDDSLVVLEYRNFRFGYYEFAQDEPAVMVFLLETRGDLISYWTLFYGLDTMEKSVGATWRVSTNRDEEARSILSSYALGWSSESPDIVADLYADDALREDTVFGDVQEGREAIGSFAESFFAWYPGARWELLQPFGEGRGVFLDEWGLTPVTGGVYKIEVPDLGGQPCEVVVAVLLRASDGQIIHESIYYEADSLIRCGWAR